MDLRRAIRSALRLDGSVAFAGVDLENLHRRRLLTDLSNASQLHDRRFPLPLCKRDGFLAISVSPGKTLAVAIEDRRQPMPMLPAFVFSVFGAL